MRLQKSMAVTLRAIEGTNAELTVQMDHTLRNGQLTLDDGKQITLSGGEGNVYKGSILMQKDGAYHVAALDRATGPPVGGLLHRYRQSEPAADRHRSADERLPGQSN